MMVVPTERLAFLILAGAIPVFLERFLPGMRFVGIVYDAGVVLLAGLDAFILPSGSKIAVKREMED